MAVNFRERFLESLTDSACEIMKKQASGLPITDNEVLFIHSYLNELDRYEVVPISKRIMANIKEVTKFVKENFGNAFSHNTDNTIDMAADDYVINTEVDASDNTIDI